MIVPLAELAEPFAPRAAVRHVLLEIAPAKSTLIGWNDWSDAPQGTSSLLGLGGVRPDDLPLAISPFVKIRVPERDGAARAALD